MYILVGEDEGDLSVVKILVNWLIDENLGDVDLVWLWWF